MGKTNYLTKEGAERLRAELEELKGPGREDLARRLRIAIEQGDLSENADYIATKEEQGFLEGRILELEQILRDVTLIEDGGGKRDSVEIGARVTIKEDGYPEETYHLVGPNEANPGAGRISHESPIGKALLGKKAGEAAVAVTPNGEIRLMVVKIE